ncbi:MAG TPA: amidohydrolase family protein, partial [Bryobacteraceae bacterium]|nr:amidohydrolase family protein [Bryobacteraceae bacterium]
MSDSLSRRRWLAGAFGLAALGAGRPEGTLVDTHVHLFDPKRFPYHKSATYRPPAATLESYTAFVKQAGIDHAVIVHPEPYQDDHRYLEYCFEHEPRPGYFKGTCLFDPLREDTPRRVKALLDRWPKRIVAMRIHAVSMIVEPSGPIRNRDMKDPRMLACWKALATMGVGIQKHFIPGQARNIRALAAAVPDTTVILDHLGRPASGTPEDYREVLKLSELPRVIMKFSGWDQYKGDLNALTKQI